MEHVIEVRGLGTRFGNHVIHDQLDFTARRGEIMGIVGGSGTGKSVLLWAILGLRSPDAGKINILGFDIDPDDPAAAEAVQARTGKLFQDGGLVFVTDRATEHHGTVAAPHPDLGRTE